MTLEKLFKLAHQTRLANHPNRLVIRVGDNGTRWAAIYGKRAGGYACGAKTTDEALKALCRRVSKQAGGTKPPSPGPGLIKSLRRLKDAVNLGEIK